MAAYYVMTNYGPMSLSNLKRMSYDKIKEILKDAPKDMDTFLEVYEKYSELVDKVDNLKIDKIFTQAQLDILNGNWQPAGDYALKDDVPTLVKDFVPESYTITDYDNLTEKLPNKIYLIYKQDGTLDRIYVGDVLIAKKGNKGVAGFPYNFPIVF